MKEELEEKLKEEFEKNNNINSLGNIKDLTTENRKNFFNDEKENIIDIGWKNIPIENLPTRGLFYPIGTKILIRAATVREIRHWSTIDENDGFSIDDAINFVIERCMKISFPSDHGIIGNFKDLKEIDRFYILLSIRELTFKDGENKLYADFPIGGGTEKVEVKKEMVKYFEIPEKLMKFYSEAERCFIFNIDNEDLKIYIPSIGITNFLKNYRIKKQQLKQNIDFDFEKFSLFIIKDWRGLSFDSYEKLRQDSIKWSLKKISILSTVVDLIKESINPSITKYFEGEGEVTIPLNFRGGIKSIFIISDILDELI